MFNVPVRAILLADPTTSPIVADWKTVAPRVETPVVAVVVVAAVTLMDGIESVPTPVEEMVPFVAVAVVKLIEIAA